MNNTMKKIRSASLKVGKVIHDELKDIIDIYPLIAPAQTTGTFAVYKRGGLRVDNTKDGYNYQEVCNLEIIIVSQTYLESVEKAIDVKLYLEHLHGTYMTAKDEVIEIADITLIDASEDWSNDAYIQTMNFQITMFNELGIN